jgi:two-component system response regulator (stage 0 sporulation protein F)
VARILVVDDDELVCSTICGWVRRMGHEVITADGADSGLAALRDFEFDAMVVDILVPQLLGFESVRLFHQRVPHVPLIAVSDYVSAERKMPASDFLGVVLKLGASQCLRKPFTPKALLHAINHCLSRRNEQSGEFLLESPSPQGSAA